MLKNLLNFELYYHGRKPLFYITVVAFILIGYLLGASGIAFPNVNINSTYQISYLTGILSLAAIFSITFSIAQSILREKETRFDVLLYATPVSKRAYLFIRLTSLLFIAVIPFIMGVAGMYLGQSMSSLPAGKTGVFRFSNYAMPVLMLAIPNVFLCVAILCSTAWLSGNKLIVYVTGLFIYILYMIGSIFSNSPLIAGSAPVSQEQMSLFARLDPFGMAAFFEQTRYWTTVEKNYRQLSLSGNFLFNRVLWFFISLGILVISYLKFSFYALHARPAKKIIRIFRKEQKTKIAGTVNTEIHTRKHNRAILLSFVKIDLQSIVKGIPFVLILVLWTAFLGIELINSIKGDPRLGENYSRTGLMISTIMQIIPFFCLVIILFYSSELIGRSKSVNFDQLENTTAAHPITTFFSKFISLSFIPLFLVAYSCVISIVLQLVKGGPAIQYNLYASLFYYLGLPLLLSTSLIISIQTIIQNKYTGLAVASLVILLTNSKTGMLLGLGHPLLRYAKTLNVPYGDMNGFGNYVTAFHWQMLYWTAFATCIILLAALFRHRSYWRKKAIKQVLFIAATIFLLSGGFIFYQTNIKYPYQSKTNINDWKEAYEINFKSYKNFAQPSVNAVKTSVDLYPGQQRYEIKGQYQLVNNTATKIDSILLYIHPLTKLNFINIKGATLIKDDSRFGHYWYRLEKSLQPGDSSHMNFSISSEWSPFKGHTPFNSIIDNGSFIRISNYYPSFGYEYDNEITSKIEREKRKMKPQDPLKKLEAIQPSPFNYEFIQLDAVVSTEHDQIAIGQGDLVQQWSSGNRNYYHYKTARPIRFRFAFSSARYQVKKDVYKNIAIEVYYDKRHAVNTGKLIADTKKTLAYCEANFGPYPDKQIRFAEISNFAEGFAATAYPSTIYMKEDGGFFNRLDKGNSEDVINQLAGHELSHQWWGTSQIDPDYREGGWILTETLAKYTELLLYQKVHGLQATLDIVRQHIDLYLSNRGFSNETPLYKTTFETPHLAYNKGLVVMYQLRQLIGENAVNYALKALLAGHAFPKPPPTSQDLLNEFYKQSPVSLHPAIDELFKEIIIYDSKIDEVKCEKLLNNKFELSFKASTAKYREYSNGQRTKIPAGKYIEIGIFYEDGHSNIETFLNESGTINGRLRLAKKPVKIVIDPMLKTIDSFPGDNERDIEITD